MRQSIFFAIALSMVLTAQADPNNDESIAQKLAESDESRLLDSDSLEIERAKHAFVIAKSVCKEQSDKELGNTAYLVAKYLRNEKIYSRPIEILEGIKAVFDGVDVKQNCTEFMKQYASVRQNAGQTHSEAVAGLRTIMKTTGIIKR